ncbi:glycosyltransferase [Pseudomonas oryzihabitans]|uniref:glycosyltransferase n=1 Tax=Pseudomonas oryzihabitans TaxID=47885 RepID=UPI00123C0E3D|nr:glycosyltransferase [Pseudomonas oryzihabitans]QEU06310.1 glycosyltransferase [Pseudomonas oryzihabitans]
MTNRYRVLQLQPDYNIKRHDFADLAEQIVKALSKDRYEVTQAFLQGRPGPDEPVSRAEHSLYFEFSERSLKGLRLGVMWRLYRFCKSQGFDVVICNRFKPVNMMLQLNRWLKVPVCIGIVHGFGEYDRSYRRRQAKRSIDEAWRFVGVSPAVRQYLLDLNCGFTARNTVAITNAIDIEQAIGLQLPRDQARQDLGLPLDRRIVGALGRLVPVKGHAYLLKAFARLQDRYPDVDLAIIGAGREQANLERLIVELGLVGRAHLLGFRADALRYVRAFDIWSMPSLAEGLGLALLEGMSGALPVIASDVPAMRPLIEGAGGVAVEPGNVEAWTSALEHYLQLDAQTLASKGQQAFAYLREHHDVIPFRQAYAGLVEEALAERKVPSHG